MATESSLQLEKAQKTVAKIETLLHLWARLEGNDKHNFNLLIDRKIEMLSGPFRNPNISPYDLLHRVLDLKEKVQAAGFDMTSVKALISKEVENIMKMNGLAYEQADDHDDARHDPEEVLQKEGDKDGDEVSDYPNDLSRH